MGEVLDGCALLTCSEGNVWNGKCSEREIPLHLWLLIVYAENAQDDSFHRVKTAPLKTRVPIEIS